MIRSNVLADVLLIAGITGLSLGAVAVQIGSAVRSLRRRSGVVRPVFLTTTSLCAGAVPSLFIVLGFGDVFGQFDRLRAFEFAGSWPSGLHLALTVTSRFAGALAITGALTIGAVVLLQLQPQRRRLAP